MTQAEAEFAQFAASRRAALAAVDGWLNLTDRVAIPAGRSTVGRSADNDIVINCGPDHLGVLDIDNRSFAAPGEAALAFQPSAGGFDQVRVGPVLLELHSDGGPFALRVRDADLNQDINIPLYPFDPEWIIDADLVELAAPQSQKIGQRGGQDTEVAITHIARFVHQGLTIELLPTHWKDGKPMFVIRDATSGRQTYGASRFLIGKVTGQGAITLDFNRLINPPCAFTEFAICPLPPRQNILAFPIEAGEKLPLTD